MTEKMELAFDVPMFMLMIIVNPLSGVAGLIIGNTTATSCDSSTANITFAVDLQNGTIPTGSETWYYEATLIATKPAGVFSPQGTYASRLHTYSTYGLALDNINAVDGGRYLFVFSYYSPTPQGFQTATTTLTVKVAPSDNCNPSYRKSGDLAICELDQTVNCGSPRLVPMWTHILGNTFTVTKAGTYTCCANGSILMDCYRGSSTFCKTFLVEADDCPLKVVLGYGLGVGLCTATICIICHVFTMIWIKIVMNIPDKKELQKSIPKGKDVTNTAFVHGFGISGVQWTGPQGNKLTSEKYNIQYDKKKGTITLKIKDLQINDSGLYTCHACESLVQDSVKLSVYEKIAVYFDIGETFRQHGSDVKIICSVYGSENKSVHWTGQEENILTNGGGHTITPYDSNTNESSLSIRNSSNTKAEGYICQVLFKESEVSVKMYVRITVSVIGLLIDIGKIILSVPASENESRKWIGPHDNILTDTEKYAIVPYDSKTNQSHLTIKNIYKNDHGFYTCQAVDSSGSPKKISITITTNDSPDSVIGASKLVLGLGFGIIFVACIACIVVILVTIGNQCVLKLGLGLGLGLGIPIIGCIIVIVILVKKDVKILAKDELQKAILEGSEVTIPAFLHGFFISSVQWIGPNGNILTSNGKYNKKYNRDTGISTLQISALERKDSGLYTCRAIGIFGTTAQDSIRISVDDCKSPTASGNRKSKSGTGKVV